MKIAQFTIAIFVLQLILPTTITSKAFLSYETLENSVKETIPLTYKSWSNTAPSVTVEVNPNIELLSIVLSMTTWFDLYGLPVGVDYTYAEDIDSGFGNHSHDLVVGQAQRMLFSGFCFDAPPNFILHFGPPPDLVQLYNYSDYILHRAYWTGEDEKEELDRFARSFRTFASETNFSTFYIDHQSFYNEIVEDVSQHQNWTEIAVTVENFFGESRSSYTVILSPFMFPGGGYGGSLEESNETHIYSIIRTQTIHYDYPDFGDAVNIKYLTLHEFAHSFINPVVDQHSEEVSEYAELFAPVAQKMAQMAYGTWPVMLYETLVRAFTIWAGRQEYGESMANQWLLSETNLGFYFIRDVYDAYFDYMVNRDKYPTFNAFFPEILRILDKVKASVYPSSTSAGSKSGNGLLIPECLLLMCFMVLVLRKKAD